jgi:uncharacterized protein YdhG (YjbR/CyaY superfamily)
MLKPADIDAYHAAFTGETRKKLEEIRTIITKAAPKAIEVISYGMPAFKQHGVLVYYAGYKSHIGFYPTGSGIEAFKDELLAYKWSKGAVRFPLDQPLPKKLITQMVQFRMAEDAEKEKGKTK